MFCPFQLSFASYLLTKFPGGFELYVVKMYRCGSYLAFVRYLAASQCGRESTQFSQFYVITVCQVIGDNAFQVT